VHSVTKQTKQTDNNNQTNQQPNQTKQTTNKTDKQNKHTNRQNNNKQTTTTNQQPQHTNNQTKQNKQEVCLIQTPTLLRGGGRRRVRGRWTAGPFVVGVHAGHLNFVDLAPIFKTMKNKKETWRALSKKKRLPRVCNGI